MKEKSLKLIENAKISKAQDEIKECTFFPRLIASARVNYNLISRSRAVITIILKYLPFYLH